MKLLPARVVALLVLLLLALVAGSAAVADVLPYGLKIERILDNSAEVGDIAQSPAGELWILERTTGTIRVFDAGVEIDSLTLGVDGSCNSGLLDVAFDPGYTVNRRAMVYYVDATTNARVDEVVFTKDGLTLGANLLSLGTQSLGCNPGGGMLVGQDRKLYVGVGDLDNSSNAQNASSLAGKILRAELDGSVPPDNPSGSLVWASGFRNGSDLATNPDTGDLYMVDLGASGLKEELNRVTQGGNYGWDVVSGDSGGTFDDPIVSYNNTLGTFGLEAMGDSFGPLHQNSLVFASSGANFLGEARLSGPNLDVLDWQGLFYRPDGDRDGTADVGCPAQFHALTRTGDGSLLAANDGANPGIWRIWPDLPGPREVSAPGSPFHLTVAKSGSNLTIGWENLGSVDAGRPPRNAGQHPQTYQIWEGTLPIGGTYDHSPTLASDGTADGPGRLVDDVLPGAGDHYYLVSAQADNLEGTLGSASDGTPRPGQTDYCATIGYGINQGQCAAPWFNHSTGGELRLVDQNPLSPTFGVPITISDFRGRVIKMDISALNCVFCDLQAEYFPEMDAKYRDRDMVIITLLTNSFVTLDPISAAACPAAAAGWAADHGETNPVVCDVDLNGNGEGDVTNQYWHEADCGGTPQNFYFDQGHVLKQFVCGGELSVAEQEAHVIGEVNPETCE